MTAPPSPKPETPALDGAISYLAANEPEHAEAARAELAALKAAPSARDAGRDDDVKMALTGAKEGARLAVAGARAAALEEAAKVLSLRIRALKGKPL